MKIVAGLIFCLFSLSAVVSQTYTLEDLIRIGWENAPQMAAARLDSVAATEGVAATRSEFFPTLSGRVSGSLLADPPAGLKIPAGSFGSGLPPAEVDFSPEAGDFSYQVGLSLQQPLFTWGKLANSLKISYLDSTIAGLNLQKTRKETAREIRKAFALSLFAEQSLSTLREVESVYQEVAADRERSFELGAINREELLQSRLQLVEIQSQVEQAIFTSLIAREQLRILTGLSDLLPEQLQGQLPDSIELVDDIEGEVARVLPDNEELQVLGIQLLQAQTATDIAARTNGPFPDLALQVDLELQGSEFPGTENWDDSWSSSLTITLGTQLTIFDGGRRRNAADIRRVQADQVALGIENQGLILSLNIIRAYEAVVKAQRHLLDTQARLNYVEEQEKNARVSYENELVTREQLLGARILLLTTILEKTSAGFEAETAAADLAFYLTEPLE
ncbi:MAG: TolC family protein [Spirochaetales bacterium]|nr:TolC family protein [Spirochaetales bacterium]